MVLELLLAVVFLVLYFYYIDFTVCFGLMSLFSNYYHKKALRMNLKALMRDIYVYLLTLMFLTFVFWDYEV